MVMTDPIADMLTRIRNANRQHHETVMVPASKLKADIAEILKNEGFIKGYKVEGEGPIKNINITLKYRGNDRVITDLKRISKPGLRVYAKVNEIPKVLNGLGNKIINVPEGVTVDIAADNTVTVTGAKGTLVRQFSPVITINKEDNVITVARSSEQKTHKQLHGTTRALLANMIEGVHEGFKKQLEIVGIGYRGQMKGNTLVLNIGYSHQVEIEAEEGVTIETPNNTTIVVSGISKERVGQVAAQIREVRKPEPYKGKGIKYSDERIIRKEGKTAGKK